MTFIYHYKKRFRTGVAVWKCDDPEYAAGLRPMNHLPPAIIRNFWWTYERGDPDRGISRGVYMIITTRGPSW